jgi:aryl-alcohol dehydrogenase-like predicted oxidoreductase
MRYRSLGSTGLLVSELSFGAMTFGSGNVINKVDAVTADAMIGRCIDAGVNLFDTADVYAGGASEEMLGRALGARRADVVVATKVGFRHGPAAIDGGLSYAHVVRSAEASLRRLGTDWIDVYQIHRPDPRTPIEETLRAFDDLRRRGLVRYTGASNMTAWSTATAIGIQQRLGYARFEVMQLYYSLLNREIEHELVPFCSDAGIGIIVWSPLSAGYLSGRYTPRDREPTDAGAGARLTKFPFPPIDRELGDRVVACLRTLGAPRGASPAQLALAWLLTKAHVTSVIVGASSLDQLEENLDAAEVMLNHDELALLDELTEPAPIYPTWWARHFVDPFD